MGAAEINIFLSHLAVDRNVASSTQTQALSALLFLYREVLEEQVPWLTDLVKAKKPRKLPVVLPKAEVAAILRELRGVPLLVVSLLYGGGLRLLEALRLRVKDIDMIPNTITVRQGKGARDRRTMLPHPCKLALEQQAAEARRLHEADLADGFGRVWLPDALAVKYPHANQEFAWQYVFPARSRSIDPRSGLTHRHHLDETTIQKARRRPGREDRQSRRLPHLPPLLRHPPPAGRLRHPDRAAASRPCRPEDDDDLHARPERNRRSRGAESAGDAGVKVG